MQDKAISDHAIKDVAIIGAGPVGLFAVFECGMLGMSCHVIDTLPHIGGQCTALYPEKPIYDIPAYPTILAQDLIKQLEAQAAPFHPVYHLGQQVVAVTKHDTLWQVQTNEGQTLMARAIIIAGGAGSFGPNRPPIQGIEAYEGHSVFYMVQNKEDFADKSIVIAGGGDSAVDWAVSLAGIAKKISIVHRRDKFRAAPETVRQMHDLADAGKIDICTPYQLSGLKGQGGTLAAVSVTGKEGQERKIAADILLSFFGLSLDLGPIATWGLQQDQTHIAIDPATCETSSHGIYAIGDIATYKNKKKLILIGFSEAAFSAHAIYDQLNPDTPLHFEYSTTKGRPQEG